MGLLEETAFPLQESSANTCQPFCTLLLVESPRPRVSQFARWTRDGGLH